jgi:hypothetical protein
VKGKTVSSDLSVFPNPSTGNLHVSFTRAAQGFTTIHLVSVEGKAVRLLQEGLLDKGFQSFEFTVRDLPQGFYLLRVIEQENVQTEKIFVIK